MSTIIFKNFEDGVTPAAGDGTWDVLTGGPWSNSTARAANGAHSLRANPTASVAQLAKNLTPGIRKIVASTRHYVAAMDSTANIINPVFEVFDAAGNAAGVDIGGLPSNPSLGAAYWNNGTSELATTTNKAPFQPGYWYLIDVLWDTSANPWKTTWYVNGVLMDASYTYALPAADITQVSFGWSGAMTNDRFWDHIFVSDDPKDFPFGAQFNPAVVGGSHR